MSDSPELTALLAEYERLDAAAEPRRAREILSRAAELVDRAAKPKKWAALRTRYGDLTEREDPMAAMAAYRDALTVWRSEEDRASWSYCQMQLGTLLATNFAPGSAEGEEAIGCLEAAVEDQPYLAELLGNLYGFRPRGDPKENWQRRVKYLEQARAALDPATEKGKWVRLTNALALACAEEPGANYATAIEQQIERQTTLLESLAETDPGYIESCIQLATAWLNRVEGGLEENGARAESYLQRALARCATGQGDAQRAQILLLLARILIFKASSRSLENLQAALERCAEARRLVAARPERELRASVEKLAATTYLALLQAGEAQHLEAFLGCCAKARDLFSRSAFPDEHRKLLQIEADGLLAVNRFPQAAIRCTEAIEAAEALIAQTSTAAGRLERIWELRDSAGLLAWCHAKSGDLPAALAALERGKALLWDRGEKSLPAPADHIPPNGALLFPIWAAREGIVLVATGPRERPVLTSVSLPQFGKTRMLELLRGPDPAELGGWLRAYCYRNSDPDTLRQEIGRVGRILHDEFWRELLSALYDLGIEAGAELVLFPHAGSAILPFQAAWRLEQGEKRWLIEGHALRYAPALKMLRSSVGVTPSCDLSLIVNPTGDLPFSALEAEWISEAVPAARVLPNEAAMKEEVLREILSRDRIHLATHAEFNLEDPFASSIQVASGGRLTLQELAPALLAQPPDFIALSACETGVSRVTSIQDEFLGFPGAFLAHGVRTVLATQWSVDDAATAVLIGQFYRELSSGKYSIAESLRRAQDWLRQLRVAEFSALLRPLRDRPGIAGATATRLRTLLRGRDPREQPFAHPYFWAGLTVSGS